MIEYRSFRNTDPPRLSRLWQEARLGRGAAQNLSSDLSLDLTNFSQTYFDPAGLIVATFRQNPVGFCQTGFGCTRSGEALDYETGVISGVVVDPDFRRRGIARELVKRGEDYLRSRGARHIQAGGSPGRDPFFFGLYGGSEPAGFLESEKAAAPFFQKLGYTPRSRYSMAVRSMSDRDPVSFKLTMVRRKWEMVLVDRPDPCSWWWMSRFGRLEALAGVLVPRGGGRPVAGCTIMGLDLYVPSWHEQAIGISELWTDESQRRQGLALTLLVDVIRKLRQENVQTLVARIPEDDSAAQAVFRSAGFATVDCGVVYDAPEQ